MPSVDNLDFLNANSLRAYPIKESSTLVSVDGALSIPNDFIVDFQLAATFDPSTRFYISRIANFDVISIEVSDQSSVLVGTFTIDTANHWQYKDYYLTPSAAYIGATGLMTLTGLKGIDSCPSGIYDFTFAATEFEPRTIIPSLRGINRITFANTAGNSYTLTGDIVVEARTNIRFKLADGFTNKIIVDAGEGLGLNTICSAPTKCIKTINGIPPDDQANFTLDFSDCATLTPIPANTGLILEDICCKPCVGCTDIEQLTNRVMSTETSLVTLQQYYTDLSNLLTNFKTTQTYTCDCPPES